MGTNYYLEPNPPICPACGHDNSEQLHIGKSSAGWVFTWHGYLKVDGWPHQDLTSPTEWEQYLTSKLADKFMIRNEYGHSIPLAELMTLVAAKREPNVNGVPPAHNKGAEVSYAGGDDILFAEFS